MDISDACFDRVIALIEDIERYMGQLPDGPERKKMEYLLEEMRKTAEKHQEK